jgi:hypothetical protein
MHDVLQGGLRMLTVLDEHTQECHVLRSNRALKSGGFINLVKGGTATQSAHENMRSASNSEVVAK